MPRLAICTILIVLTCWPTSSDEASLSLEDKLQQLADNYVSIFEFSSFFLPPFRNQPFCVYDNIYWFKEKR